MKRLIAIAAAAVVALSGVAGTTAASAATTKNLNYGVMATFKSWEVRSSGLGVLAPVYYSVYDALIGLKPDGSFAPGLATSWKYDELQTGLTLKLRPNVTFSNGEKFNAAAVCANLNAFKSGDSDLASQLAGMQSCKVKGPLTVLITIADVDPALLLELSQIAGMQQAPKTIGTAAAKTKPVGTGPYILDTKRSVADSVYYLKANPKYWNKGAIKFNTLTLKIITDVNALGNALRTGQIDIAGAQPTQLDALKAAGLSLYSQQANFMGLILVDRDGSMGSPLKSVKVRQALNYAFDRAAMLKVLANGQGRVTEQVFPPYSKAYDKSLENTYNYDPAKAKQLLAEAGYANGFTIALPSLNLLDGGKASQMFAAQLAAVGITVKFTDFTSVPQFFGSLLAPLYPAFAMVLETSANPWAQINFLINRNATWNPSHYGDTTSDALIAKIQTATGAAQVKYLKQLNAYMVQQAWYVPIYGMDSFVAYNPKVVKFAPGTTVYTMFPAYGVVPAK